MWVFRLISCLIVYFRKRKMPLQQLGPFTQRLSHPPCKASKVKARPWVGGGGGGRGQGKEESQLGAEGSLAPSTALLVHPRVPAQWDRPRSSHFGPRWGVWPPTQSPRPGLQPALTLPDSENLLGAESDPSCSYSIPSESNVRGDSQRWPLCLAP